PLSARAEATAVNPATKRCKITMAGPPIRSLWPECPPSRKHSGAASRLLSDHPLEGREELVHVGLRHGQGAAAEAALRQDDAFVQKTHEGAERALRIRGAARSIVAEPLLGPVNPEERPQSRHLRGLLRLGH